MASRVLRFLLLSLLAFLALTAVAGGLGLLGGLVAPPAELLSGTPFGSYLVPGLALLLLVGGGAALAAVLVWRRHRLGLAAALAAGLMILVFEAVEVWAIGSDPGVARNLQQLYVGVGAGIVLLAGLQWALDRRLARQA
jgi:hypothetical protein